MSATESAPNAVDQIVEKFLERYRRGERPTISEYEQKHPEHAEQIRELIPTLVVMEQLKPGEPDSVSSSSAGIADAAKRYGELLSAGRTDAASPEWL